MAKFTVTVTQSYRAERKIDLEIEADSQKEADEMVASGSEDLPGFDDPRWRTGWQLQSEMVNLSEMVDLTDEE